MLRYITSIINIDMVKDSMYHFFNLLSNFNTCIVTSKCTRTNERKIIKNNIINK